jgi:hypothetical protein
MLAKKSTDVLTLGKAKKFGGNLDTFYLFMNTHDFDQNGQQHDFIGGGLNLDSDLGHVLRSSYRKGTKLD